MRSENIIFKKVVNFGTVKNIGNIFCEIIIKDKGEYKELTISGVEGPRKTGNCRGSCGQINDTIVEHIKRDEFNKFAGLVGIRSPFFTSSKCGRLGISTV